MNWAWRKAECHLARIGDRNALVGHRIKRTAPPSALGDEAGARAVSEQVPLAALAVPTWRPQRFAGGRIRSCYGDTLSPCLATLAIVGPGLADPELT
jgi:hypothetical protein